MQYDEAFGLQAPSYCLRIHTWAVHGAVVVLSRRACLRAAEGYRRQTASAASSPGAEVSAAIDQLQRFVAIITALFLVAT